MSPSMQPYLFVLVMGPTDAYLSNLVVRRNWPIVSCDDLAGAIRQVIAMQPAMLLVQVDERRGLQRVVDVLAALRSARPDARLYVWAPRSNDDLERAVRSVGIHAYAVGDAGLLALQDVVAQSQSRDRPVRIHSPPPAAIKMGRPP